jgi:HEPN domain-containing protein
MSRPVSRRDILVIVADRSSDWFRQAQRDLEQAQSSAREDRHEWACFAAQQAAEKAVKALHLALGQEAFGHVVARLLRELPIETPVTLIDQARVLDSFYIPTRYANGHPEGAPFEHFGTLQSTDAIRHAGAIIAFIRSHLAER